MTIIEYRQQFPTASMFSISLLKRYSDGTLAHLKTLSDDEVALRIQPMLANHKITDGMRKKWSQATKRQWANPKSRAILLATSQSPEANRKRSEAMKGHTFPAERNEKVRQAALRQWQNPVTRERIVQALLNMRSPNKQELQLQAVLDSHFPNEWKFVGNGQLIIAGLCPDFVNVNGKKLIIEFFGKYWHSKVNPKYNESCNEDYRIQAFAKFGYKTLVIWDNELSNESELMDKIIVWLRGT